MENIDEWKIFNDIIQINRLYYDFLPQPLVPC